MPGSFDPEEWAKKCEQHVPSEELYKKLKRTTLTLEDIATLYGVTKGVALDAIESLRSEGYNVQEYGGGYSIEKSVGPMGFDPNIHKLTSDVRGHYRVGLIADTHYGSKYAREEVVADLYDWFAKQGITKVYHCGNWVDGECRFNKFDLLPEAHGMSEQFEIFVERYPRRKGITTYYVAGDDHEGWWLHRDGVDVGKVLEDHARREGRKDLVYIGYKEAFIRLEHRKTKKHARMIIDHPGMGSAYAQSYAPQKVVEAAQPGEKPAVWCFGHWHKMGYNLIRGVHCIQVPCTQDLTPWARKKRLTYVIGGAILELVQDPGGAVVECIPHFKTYYDRAYHNAQYEPVEKRRRKKK